MNNHPILTWLMIAIVISVINFFIVSIRNKIDFFHLAFSSCITAVITTALAWLFISPVSIFLFGTYVKIFFIASASALAYMLACEIKNHDDYGRTWFRLPAVFWSAYLAVLFVVAIFLSFPPLHDKEYASLMVPKMAERDSTTPLVDQTQARIVTDALALKRAAEILATSDEEGLGSRITMGEPWGNKINGTYFWVIPIEHAGFWKWMNFDSTPGYIAVAQNNENNTKFIQNKPIKIGTMAWFKDNIYRHLYNNGFTSVVMGTAIFQPDEDWNPYWVVPMSLPQVGFGGKMPVKWALVDATNGDIQVFDKIEDVPAWVDRLYHQEMVQARFDSWGCYSQGWHACIFSGSNVVESTRGINVTIDVTGNIVYYSGTQFQSSSSAGASSGFYTVNARNGQITFYRREGITEETAKSVMEGAFANFEGYKVADCVLLSMGGEDTFFSIIVDKDGSRKAFAFVSQSNRNTLGKGESLQSAVNDFNRAKRREVQDSNLTSETMFDDIAVEGKVLTMVPILQNSRTSFYLTLDTLSGKVVEVSEEVIGEIVVTKIGDRVRVTTESTKNGIIFSTSFDNLDFEFIDASLEETEGGVLLETAEEAEVITPDQ